MIRSDDTGTSVGDFFSRCVDRAPDEPALTFLPDDGTPTSLTHAELAERVERVAGLLIELFPPHSRVGIWGGNRPEWLVLYLAGTLAGLELVPLNDRATPAEVQIIAHDAGLVGLFHERDQEVARSVCPPGTRCLTIDSAITASQTCSPARRAVAPDDVVQVQYTSGTSGRPKGALLSHRGVTTTPVLATRGFGLRDPARWLTFTPMHHIGGCVLPVLGCLGINAEHVLGQRYRPDAVLTAFGDHGITFFGGVPAVLFDLLERYNPELHDASTLEAMLTGGAPVPADLVRKAAALFEARVIVAYGQTETHGHITQTLIPGAARPALDAASAIGTPLPHMEVRIVAPGAGAADRADLPSGEVGELICRTKATMRGYLGRPADSERAFDPPDWLRTGDLCRIDADGVVHFVGRISESINRGGEKISPGEVESALRSHPLIREAAVLGVPDERLGQRVAAFVVAERAPGSGAVVDVAELRVDLREFLAAHKIPEVWRLVDELPLADSGKVNKSVLASRLVQEQTHLMNTS